MQCKKEACEQLLRGEGTGKVIPVRELELNGREFVSSGWKYFIAYFRLGSIFCFLVATTEAISERSRSIDGDNIFFRRYIFLLS